MQFRSLAHNGKAFLNCDYAQRFFGAVYKCRVVGSAGKETKILTIKYKNMTTEDKFQKVIQDTILEIKRQDNKWGADRDNHPLVWLSIIQEEFGELAKEINDADFQTENLSENYRKELVQIVAVGLQAIKNYDWFKANSSEK